MSNEKLTNTVDQADLEAAARLLVETELPQEAARFQLDSAQRAYLDTFMGKVSRSFAGVVPFLEEPLNHYVAAAYLLFRVVDNIEDCGRAFAWKKERYAEFSGLLSEPWLASEVLSVWEGEAWPALTPEEKQLMTVSDGKPLWAIYELIPESARTMIRRWTSAMARGMSQIEDPEQAPWLVKRDGVELLAGETDYHRYCYIVAGTVGHMATELVLYHYGLTDGVADRLLANSEACGRALQKANIVQDFAEDLERGICFLPDEWMREVDYSPFSLRGAPADWKQKVLKDVMEDLDDATDYVLALPYRTAGYRMASLMCLLPAYQTILLAAQQQENLFTAEHHARISPQTMAQCLQDAQAMVADNEAVRAYRQRSEYAYTRS